MAYQKANVAGDEGSICDVLSFNGIEHVLWSNTVARSVVNCLSSLSCGSFCVTRELR